MMGFGSGVIRAIFTLAVTVIIPIQGNAIARANGITLVLISENTIVAIGIGLTIIAFFTGYLRGTRNKARSLLSVSRTLIQTWYFLLFLTMISSISLPQINTEVHVQYMGGLGEVPTHFRAVIDSIAGAGTDLSFPILGDLILVVFSIKLLREVLLVFEAPARNNEADIQRPSPTKD